MNLPDPLLRRRKRQSLAFGSLILFFVLIVMLQQCERAGLERIHPRTGTPALELDVDLDALRRVQVSMADDTYQLVRSEFGWAMDRVDGYPIADDRIGAFLADLTRLEWGEALTSDPRKHDRLGVADPDIDGRGVEIRLYDETNRALASLIVGRREEALYLRMPGDSTAFRGIGALPPLQTRQGWLDFTVIAVAPEAIEAVTLNSESDTSLTLVRVEGGGPREFAPGLGHENERLVSRLAAATPALALSRFAPLDVKSIAQLTTRPTASHRTQTSDGLIVDVHTYDEPDGYFVTVRAAERGPSLARAQAINARTRGWAFQLSRYDWADFTIDIADVVERPRVAAPPE